MKKSKIIKVIIVAVLIVFVVVLLIPFSRFYIGPKLTVEMSIEVNGVETVPYNIVCTSGAGETKKIRTVNKEGEVVLYIDAFKHNMYTISYDVDTEDGVKHFSYGIVKTHQGGPRDSFWYYVDLDKDKETGEWEARIWLDRKNAETCAHTILLSEDESAYVQYGP